MATRPHDDNHTEGRALAVPPNTHVSAPVRSLTPPPSAVTALAEGGERGVGRAGYARR